MNCILCRSSICETAGIKGTRALTDTSGDMIISEEQVRLAVRYLQTPDAKCADHYDCSAASIPPELLDRVKAQLDSTPETRQDRVDHARSMLDGQKPSSREVADKMIGRIVSDSLR